MPPDAVGIGGDFVNGRAADWFKGCQVQQFPVGVDQAPGGKRGSIPISEFEIKKGFEPVIFPNAQVGQHFFFYDKDFSRGLAGEATGDAGLYDQVGGVAVDLSHERPGSSGAADACDE